MASDSDEAEIKIEYNETFETDPLCDNFETNVTEKFVDDKINRSLQVENEVTEVTTLETNCEDIIEEEDSCKDSRQLIATGNQATWYKLIDQSGKYLCQFCDLTYSTIQTLRHHIKIKHPTEAKNLKTQMLNNKRNRKLKCHICKTRFKLLKELKEHVERSHEIENLQISCNNCDATFSNRKEMSEHLYYKHNTRQTKLFTCLTCGYRTTKKSHYNQHKNTHLIEKFHKCPSCDYSTNYLPNMKIHVRIHTNQKPYSCDYNGCQYNCAAKSALRSHQLKHNREANMLYCDKCSYTTVYKQSLKKHTASHERNSLRIKF